MNGGVATQSCLLNPDAGIVSLIHVGVMHSLLELASRAVSTAAPRCFLPDTGYLHAAAAELASARNLRYPVRHISPDLC